MTSNLTLYNKNSKMNRTQTLENLKESFSQVKSQYDLLTAKIVESSQALKALQDQQIALGTQLGQINFAYKSVSEMDDGQTVEGKNDE